MVCILKQSVVCVPQIYWAMSWESRFMIVGIVVVIIIIIDVININVVITIVLLVVIIIIIKSLSWTNKYVFADSHFHLRVSYEIYH